MRATYFLSTKIPNFIIHQLDLAGPHVKCLIPPCGVLKLADTVFITSQMNVATRGGTWEEFSLLLRLCLTICLSAGSCLLGMRRIWRSGLSFGERSHSYSVLVHYIPDNNRLFDTHHCRVLSVLRMIDDSVVELWHLWTTFHVMFH